ncbi:MAG: tetratricopeptide repeat protein, partial [Crocosphaera sp.]
MTSEQLMNDLDNLKQQANKYLIKGNYAKAASCFEEAIAIEPDNKSNYWHLGLIFLLQEQE